MPDLRDDALVGAAAAAAADPADMLRAVAGSGAQVRRSASACHEAGLAALSEEGRPRSLVVLAARSAAVAGDVLTGLAGPGCAVPVVTVVGHDLPAWVGAADVVVALSGSGAEEEVLALLEAVARRGSRLLAAAPPGSAVHERARQSRALFVPVPPDLPPRAALWSLTTPLAVAGSHLGLLPERGAALTEALEATAARLDSVAERCRPGSDAPVNPAKVLATELGGTLPVVWGTSALAGAAARRFASQLVENAGVAALHGVLPAATDQLGVLDGPLGALARDAGGDFFRDRVDDPEPGLRPRLVLLRDTPAVEHPRVARQAEACRELTTARDVRLSTVMAQGESGYERMAELIGVTDYASVYLALLHGVDPSRAGALAELERSIAR